MASFTLAYLAASTLIALLAGNSEFLYYIVVMLMLIGVVGAVHRRVGLSGAVLWGLSFWGLAHMAGGLLTVPEGWPVNGENRVLYSLWLLPGRLKYDHVVHAYGFGMTTWVCWQGLRAAAERHGAVVRPTIGLLVLSAAAGMGFGALNELVEFVATLAVPETNVGGYLNTGWDLVANLFGVTAAAALIWLSGRATAETRRSES
ncbi:MAG: DUF2238 domain-containing protein [Gemmatimonadota bacterium]